MRRHDRVEAIENMLQEVDATYERDLAALEARRRQDRDALERALAIATRQLTKEDSELPAVERQMSSHRNGKASPPRPLVKISVRQAVKEAIGRMPEEFTLNDIREYLKRAHPEVIQGTGPRTVGARLSEFYSEEKIIGQVRKGAGGEPSVYRRLSQPESRMSAVN
jgi:hypothetical protein